MHVEDNVLNIFEKFESYWNIFGQSLKITTLHGSIDFMESHRLCQLTFHATGSKHAGNCSTTKKFLICHPPKQVSGVVKYQCYWTTITNYLVGCSAVDRKVSAGGTEALPCVRNCGSVDKTYLKVLKWQWTLNGTTLVLNKNSEKLIHDS